MLSSADVNGDRHPVGQVRAWPEQFLDSRTILGGNSAENFVIQLYL